ncbi:hypothetical protein [Streptomyces sp. NBC_01716]|uniref:hypothetical protein n=1 Tax=Streptomyces sp. NBC_01716 TaxID=2975917 RepID=UPI002E36F2A3|nr:hypothetical protein [Streptomyces sp. NBC_01716]
MTKRQKIVRVTLIAGVLILVMLLVLASCGGTKDDDAKPRKPVPSSGPETQLNVPDAYNTRRGWEIEDVSPQYAVASANGLVAYLARADDGRYQLRTQYTETGKAGWSGQAWRPLAPVDRYPRLLAVTKGDKQYFVTWSYGRLGEYALASADSLVSLDVYDAATGEQRRVEVPWTDAPTVTGTGPGILISDGKAVSAVVDPSTGEVSRTAPGSLGFPKDCPDCKKLTEVRGVTANGLLVSGAKEFWVRGGWFSRKVAPKGTEPKSGVPASMSAGHVLAKWQKKKGAKDAATHEMWVVHALDTGKMVAQVRCRKPAINPGADPQLVSSPDGRYLIAGRLAFDLDEKKAFCFEESDGTRPLTLTSVTDTGVAYGATSARTVTDALSGGGNPVQVSLTTGEPEPLPLNVRLPSGDANGVGLFRWTDPGDRPHLIAYLRRDED